MFTPHEQTQTLQALFRKIRELEERIIALELQLQDKRLDVTPAPYNTPEDSGFPEASMK